MKTQSLEVPDVLTLSARTGPSRREQLLEVVTFLFLIVPSMGLSFFAIRQGTLSFVLTAVATILRDLSLVGLITFFLWRNGESFARIGWSFRSPSADVLLGVLGFAAVFAAAAVLEQLFRSAGLPAPATPLPRFLTADGRAQLGLAVLLVLVVAVAEETIFRGYLILRLQAVTGSRGWAVLLSSLVFALGHGYEGTAGVATVGAMGAIYALVYLRTGSLAAPIVMHFLQDFIGIVLVPLLGRR